MLEKYVVYTAGVRGVTIKRFAEALDMDVVAFFDKNLEIQGKKIDGIEVFSEEKLEKFIYQDYQHNKVIVGNSIYYEEIVKYLNSKFNSQVIILKPEIIKKRYWNQIIYPFREKMTNEYSVIYDTQANEWIQNIMSEVEYWVRMCASLNGIYHKQYCERIKKKNSNFFCSRIMDKVCQDSVVIDAGCGICSQYGNEIDGNRIQLIAIDPLAYFYNTINLKSLGVEEKLVKFGMFEFLSLYVGQNVADVILIDNALDHCIDPFKSILECLATLKVGGTLSMRHHKCEAVFEGYSGLHKWNVDVNDNNEFILWNKHNFININEKLAWFAEVCVVYNNLKDDFIDINITKMKNFNMNLFYDLNGENSRLAYVIENIMKIFSTDSINLQFMKLLEEL